MDKYKTLYEWALAYRAQGVNIVPLYGFEKAPKDIKVLDNGQWVNGWKALQSRMATDDEFSEWFTGKAKPTGIGVITGAISGIVVVDVDSYKSGGMQFHLDSPLKAQTGRGGTHYYFRYDKPVRNMGFQDGVYIEVKSDGGFIVLPPTLVWVDNDPTKIGSYRWIRAKCPFKDLPVLQDSDLDRYRKATGVYHDMHDMVKAELGTQHNNLRTIALKVFARFPQGEWDLAAGIIRQMASEFTPPHPHNRVEKLIKDAANFIKQNKNADIDEFTSVLEPNTTISIGKERVKERALERTAPKTGYRGLDALVKGFVPGHLYTLTGETNVGKCLGKGTRILLHNGRIKNVEDIKVGDVLMGPNGKGRTVLTTTTGTDEMYLVDQQWGLPYIVNKDHILSLKWAKRNSVKKSWKEYKEGDVVNISVIDYLSKSNLWKKFCKGWFSSLDFKDNPLILDPYFLGLWLGDGASSGARITTGDKEVVDYLREYAKENELFLREDKGHGCQTYVFSRGRNMKRINPILQGLRMYKLINNKHIPFEFRCNSEKKRLDLLAGIIDSDGWVQKNRSKRTGKECFSYAITITDAQLSYGIFLLVRSLGFNARIRTKQSKMKRKDGSIYSVLSYTISIQGDLERIPVRIVRKKIHSVRKKNHKLTKISIKSLGIGSYYGFTLDGDGLFLLADCTVTHNTSVSCNFAINVSRQGKRVLYFALEPDNTVVDYLASVRKACEFDKLDDSDVVFEDPHIKVYTKDEVGTQAELLRSLREQEERFDLVIIDHIGYFIKSKEITVEQSNLIKELVSLAKEHKFAIMMIAHLRKSNVRKRRDPIMDDISGSAAFKQDATDVLIVTKQDQKVGQWPMDYFPGNIYVAKSKSGPNGHVPICFMPRSAYIFEEDNREQSRKEDQNGQHEPVESGKTPERFEQDTIFL